MCASGILDEPLGDWNFSQFFSVRGVDYQGEEIRLARDVVWESIEPSLPQQVGLLDLREFCNGGVLHYVNHFEEFLFPVCDQVIGKPPWFLLKTPLGRPWHVGCWRGASVSDASCQSFIM